MGTPVRLATFAVGALAVFGAAFGVGRAVGPVGDDDPTHQPAHDGSPASPEGGGPSTTHPAGHDGEGSEP